MLCIGSVSFVAGLFFLMLGAWPVFGFFGLDVLLIWLAFHLNYRSANRHEEVNVSLHEVVVRKVGPRDQYIEMRYNPFWLKLETTQTVDEGVTHIRLRSHGEEMEIGSFLNPVDRTTFAQALKNALMSAKSGGLPVQ